SRGGPSRPDGPRDLRIPPAPHAALHPPELPLLAGERGGGNEEGLRLLVQCRSLPPDLLPGARSRPRTDHPPCPRPLRDDSASGVEDPADNVRPPLLHPARVPLHV